MRDYSRILEASKKSSLQRIINLGADQKLNEWNTLRLLEDMSGKMRNRLDGVMENQWKHQVAGVNLDLSEVSGKARRLMLKAQIYRVSNQELTLKVFAHELLADGKAKRVARAIYKIKIIRDMQQGKAA